MTPSLEGLPTKDKEEPSPHEVRLAPLDTNPIFQCLWVNFIFNIFNNFLGYNSKSLSDYVSVMTLKVATLAKFVN